MSECWRLFSEMTQQVTRGAGGSWWVGRDGPLWTQPQEELAPCCQEWSVLAKSCKKIAITEEMSCPELGEFMGRLFLTAVIVDGRRSGSKIPTPCSLYTSTKQGARSKFPAGLSCLLLLFLPQGIPFPPEGAWVLCRGLEKAQVITWYRRKLKIEGCSAPQRTLGVGGGTSWENQALLPPIVQQSSLCKLKWGISRTPLSKYRIIIPKFCVKGVLHLQQGSNRVVASQRQLMQQLLAGIHLVNADTDEAQFSISCCL